jgi:RNA polymerase sigma-70 factor, ECF subfamily
VAERNRRATRHLFAPGFRHDLGRTRALVVPDPYGAHRRGSATGWGEAVRVGTQERDEPLDAFADGVRRGDPEAVAAVYLEMAPALRGFLLRGVRHGEVADDLLEQTFLELLEGSARFAGDGRALRAWLFRAARNNLLDWRKRAARRSDHELTPGRVAALADEGPDPAEQVVAASSDPRLAAALTALTEDQREVVELRIVAQLPVARVAEITGRTAGAVRVLQHRALRRLAELLATTPG